MCVLQGKINDEFSLCLNIFELFLFMHCLQNSPPVLCISEFGFVVYNFTSGLIFRASSYVNARKFAILILLFESKCNYIMVACLTCSANAVRMQNSNIFVCDKNLKFWIDDIFGHFLVLSRQSRTQTRPCWLSTYMLLSMHVIIHT